MRLALLLGLIFCCYCLPAQNFTNETCGTKDTKDPYFDREEFLSFQKEKAQNPQPKNIINLPLAIRIVRRSDGTGGLPTSEIEEIMDSLNARFQGSNLLFYQCGDPAFVDVNVFYDFDRDLYADSLVTYNIPDVINVYFISKIINGASFLCGYASFPWNTQEYVVVKNDCALNGSTLAHEIGHYLGLWHTHTTINGTEYADGSNCVFAGDELCGTPADPTLGTRNVDTTCTYTGTTKDANGDFYTPDPTNIMSYSRKACRTYFSQDQFDRMEFYRERFRSELTCQAATGLENQEFLTGLRLHPNPAFDKIRLEFTPEKSAPIQIELLDIFGRKIRGHTFAVNQGPFAFDMKIRSLSSGIYYVRFIQENRQQLVKFVKS